METTEGTLLGGRVRYAQPLEGYRTGIEPVLLAASVPARPGQRVVEAGTGAGAGLLCLAARVGGVQGLGIEIDPAMAALARDNIAANGLAGLAVEAADVLALAAGPFDHAFANPPWHDPRSSLPPSERRRQATHEGAAGVEGWVGALAGMLGPGGSLTLMLPPGLVGRARAAMAAAGLGGGALRALTPRQGRAAKLVLMQAWRGPAGPMREGETVLHTAEGGFSAVAEQVLRHGAALDLGG